QVGNDFHFDLTSAVTSAIKPGKCQAWLIFTEIADSTQRITEYVGILTVSPNPLGTLAPSQTQIMLDKVLATIKILLAQPEQTASFNGQSYQLYDIEKLYKIRD